MSQIDCFLKIDGVDGESTDAKHPNEILLRAWSFGASNPVSLSAGGGGGSGKVTLRDFTFTKSIDKASVRLFVASCSGEHFKTATLTCRKAGAQPFEFLIIVLSSVAISSYQVAAPADGNLPEEQVTLAYAKIVISETPQLPNGAQGAPIAGGWDASMNRKI